MRSSLKPGIVIGLVILLLAPLAHAGDWPNWRGPEFTGASNETSLPQTWSTTQNVAWVAPLPGPGASTPIICNGCVFLTSIQSPKGDPSQKEVVALCLDAKTGKILWQKTLGSAKKKLITAASPSPVTDGKSVYFLTSVGDFAAFDYQGNPLWTRQIQTDHGQFFITHGFSSSPLFHNDRLYLAVLHRDQSKPTEQGVRGPLHRNSFLLAIDARTGKDLWKTIRPTDATSESQEAYATPILFKSNGQEQIVTAGADYLTGHDPQTGQELWRWGDFNPKKTGVYRIVPTPLAIDNHGIIVIPRRNTPLLCIQPGQTGNLTNATGLAWTYPVHTPDACTPLYYKNNLYVMDDDRKILTCLDPKTGKQLWQGELGGSTPFRASLSAGDNKIYCINEAGEVLVLSAGPHFQILSRIPMGQAVCHSTISIANSHLFIRTSPNLYCIGKK